jgi:hypothetical protein
VAGRRAARGGAGGGDVVQAPRPTRPRLITGLGAVALCAALVAYPLPRSGPFSGFLLLGGALGGVLFATTLVTATEELLPWALGVLGAEYAGSLYVPGGATAGAAPLYGAGVLLLSEVTAWSLSLRTRMREEPPVLLLRLTAVAVATAASALLGLLLVALATANTGGGVGWTAVGTAAAVGAVALVVRAVRR